MAHKSNVRLFKVSTGNMNLTGIEAKTADEAIALACKQHTMWKRSNIDSVVSEPIFEGSIGLEVDAEDVSENGIFEITVRGTDEKLVDALKKALGYLIPGPHHFDEKEWDESLCRTSYPLKKFISDSEVTVNAF